MENRAMSLEELKAENAAEETETQEQPQAIEEEVTDEAAETETEESSETAEISEPEAEAVEAEDWMQGDDDTTEKSFTSSDIAAAKKKLRAKLDRKHEEETNELKAELERLRSAQPAKELNRPNRDDFDDEEQYLDAYVDWKAEKQSAARAAKSKQAEQLEHANRVKQEVSQGVDSHYERAIKLSEGSGISPELYQQADHVVRSMVDSVFPNQGDLITDTLIANLGEGSEKVFYHLGVNSERRAKLKDLLAKDTSGMKAAMYLGSLKSELIAPAKRKTNAPKPAAQPQGDQTTGDKFKSLKKRYDSAKDAQSRFDAKREAKLAGADTSNW